MKGFLAGILLTLVILTSAIWFAATRGYINFAADQRPSFIEEHLSMSAVDASSERRAPEKKNPLPATQANYSAAKPVYNEYCSNCHGDAGKGDGSDAMMYDPSPSDLTDAAHMNKLTDGEIYYQITQGRKPMPSFRKKLREDYSKYLDLIDLLPPAPAAPPAEGSPATAAPPAEGSPATAAPPAEGSPVSPPQNAQPKDASPKSGPSG